ncbi:cation:proton antiporter [Candidatus Bathyarchaeota archaeon]|nr:cation:proton antiporter [Candidatus Bathyarchaeota archaeon]
MEFLTDIVAILIVSLFLIILMNRFRLPTVTGLLIAGMIIGPYGVSLIKNTLLIDVLGELGVILLLFLLGLELNPKELSLLWNKTLIFALCEISASFILGFILGAALSWSFIESFILASTLSISSTAIIGKIIMDEFKLNAAESKLIISTLIAEDLFAVFLLILMPGLFLNKVNLTQFLFITLKAAILILTIFLATRFLISRVIDKICHYDIEVEEAGFLLSLTLCLTAAYLSKFLGFSPGIGAFLSGLFLLGKRARFIYEKLRLIKDLFIILFFVSMGMLIDFSFLTFGKLVFFVFLASVAGKVLGFITAGAVTGFKNKAYKMGLTMIPRGEFSFIIAKTSISLGIASSLIFPLTGAVVLITSIFGALIKIVKKPSQFASQI